MSKNDIEVVVSFPSRIADRLRPFVSTEETRYYLNGIHIVPQPVGARFEATNGHILGVQYEEEIACHEDIILTLPKPALVASAIGKLGGLYTVYKAATGYVLGMKRLADNRDGAPSIFENDMLVPGCRIDGTFPDCDRVIPRDGLLPHPGVFNYKNLGIAAAAIGASYVKPLGQNAESPALVSSSDGKFVAVIMPMRDTQAATALPAWLAEAKKKAA